MKKETFVFIFIINLKLAWTFLRNFSQNIKSEAYSYHSYSMLHFNQKCKLSDVGFEPTRPKRQLIQSCALDHSATETCKTAKYLNFVITSYVFKSIFLDWIFGLGENLLFSCRKKFPVCPPSCRKWQIQPGNFRLPAAYVEPWNLLLI